MTTPDQPAVWRDISSAPKDGTRIWAVMRMDLDPRIEAWRGVQIPLRHEGRTSSGYDLGWSVAAPLGFGGIPDRWIAGWMPLPPPPGEGDGGGDVAEPSKEEISQIILDEDGEPSW